MGIIERDMASALEERAKEVGGRLSLMGNPKRLLILCLLAKGEMSVGAIAQALSMSQSSLSQHLAKLREGGLVSTRREAQTIHYAIGDAQTRKLMEALYDVFCNPD